MIGESWLELDTDRSGIKVPDARRWMHFLPPIPAPLPPLPQHHRPYVNRRRPTTDSCVPSRRSLLLRKRLRLPGSALMVWWLRNRLTFRKLTHFSPPSGNGFWRSWSDFLKADCSGEPITRPVFLLVMGDFNVWFEQWMADSAGNIEYNRLRPLPPPQLFHSRLSFC